MDRFVEKRARPAQQQAATFSSVNDLLTWAGSNSQAACTLVSSPDTLLHNGMSSTASLTSTFSGVCAETVASNQLHAYLQDSGFPDISKFRHLASIEKDSDCRLEQSGLTSWARMHAWEYLRFLQS